jgi:hypothetical protein
MDEENEYGTTSIYQGAAYISKDEEYKGFDDDGFSEKINFRFKRTPSLDKITSEFVSGTLMVNCERFISAWQRLRRAIDESGRRNGQGNGKKFRR